MTEMDSTDLFLVRFQQPLTIIKSTTNQDGVKIKERHSLGLHSGMYNSNETQKFSELICVIGQLSMENFFVIIICMATYCV